MWFIYRGCHHNTIKMEKNPKLPTLVTYILGDFYNEIFYRHYDGVYDVHF